MDPAGKKWRGEEWNIFSEQAKQAPSRQIPCPRWSFCALRCSENQSGTKDFNVFLLKLIIMNRSSMWTVELICFLSNIYHQNPNIFTPSSPDGVIIRKRLRFELLKTTVIALRGDRGSKARVLNETPKLENLTWIENRLDDLIWFWFKAYIYLYITVQLLGISYSLIGSKRVG